MNHHDFTWTMKDVQKEKNGLGVCVPLCKHQLDKMESKVK